MTAPSRVEIVEALPGGADVVCCVIATREKVAIVVNPMYPDAEAHARAHLPEKLTGIWICGPECDTVVAS
jgi:hypothetical protein